MKNVIKKAIKESNLNGYKWTIKGNKLFWSYLTKEYFEIETGSVSELGIQLDIQFVKVIYKNPILEDETFICIFVGDDDLICDAKTIDEAIEKAVKQTIKKANTTF